ncbi:hypothetical protein TVAG_062810 [Trichomonas vaginalis G3]|uniref:Exportin-1 C-terminal domain-containing protein n=1 Tax=Trichomonas vaginalis (strain ATCC PRA-98 / G3) TaxID=412133 RepID=A2DLP3_TRIV3|nr:nuclear export signal receptor protein [Trichomonas vaginalis G3]EAY18676.1 hypothetical protein TVAG_062810 [Trichomonas vaginalis G3]KAI5522575.1 nuclear export signal receptor protein [Trichomonas vaginalis G3]|eukprot:XP_001579662.1 hypothetical protein [Trichomonas vaginalis G3]
MLSSEEIENLEHEITKFYGGSMSLDEFTQWYINEDSFPKLKSILFYPNSSRNAIHFALCGITNLIDSLFTQWTTENFLQLSNEFLALLYNEIARFDDDNSFVCLAYCRMYATMTMYGWNTSPDFAKEINDLEKFFNSSFHHYKVGIILCREISKKMDQLRHLSTIQMTEFRNETMSTFLSYAFNTLNNISSGGFGTRFSQPELHILQLESLQLLIALFEFNFNMKITTENENSKADQMKVEIPQKWITTIPFDQLVTLVYNLYSDNDELMQKQSLDVIFLLAAIQKRSLSTENINFNKNIRSQIFASSVIQTNPISSFFGVLISGISEVIENEIHLDMLSNVQAICAIFARIRNSIDSKFLVELDFPRFVRAATKLTYGIFSTSFLAENPWTILDIMKFWKQLAPIALFNDRDEETGTVVQPNIEYAAVIKEIYGNYISLILTFINENPTKAIEIIFAEFNEITKLIEITHNIAMIDMECLNQILQAFNAESELYFSSQSDPSLNLIEIRMIFFALTMVSFLASQRMNQSIPNGNLMDIFLNYTSALLKFITNTGNLVDKQKGGSLVVEAAVLLITNVLSNTLIIKSAYNSPDIPDFIKENNGFTCVQEVVALILRRIFLSTNYFAEHKEIISLATASLEKYITCKERQFIDEAVSVVFLDEFMNFETESQFQFLFMPDNAESRVKFYSIISSIMIRMWKTSDKFRTVVQRVVERIESYNKSFNEDSYILDLLALNGFFKGSYSNDHYLSMVEFFYPASIENMINHIPEAPAAIPHLMDFLEEFVFNRAERIKFPKHSAQGLLIFKTVAVALTNFFNIIDVPNFENLENSIATSMSIMTKILSNPESNIGAIETYEDPTLTNLFVAYFDMCERVNYEVFTTYPPILNKMLELIETIFNEFSDYIIQNKPSFIVASLKIAQKGLDQTISMKDIIETPLAAVKSIGVFSLNNMEVPEFQPLFEEMKPSFEFILVLLEKELLKLSYRNVIGALEIIVKLNLDNWPLVRTRLRLFFDTLSISDQKDALSVILGETEEEVAQEEN